MVLIGRTGQIPLEPLGFDVVAQRFDGFDIEHDRSLRAAGLWRSERASRQVLTVDAQSRRLEVEAHEREPQQFAAAHPSGCSEPPERE